MSDTKHTILITGGGAGIGRRIAERFLAEGRAVHICDASAQHVQEFLHDNPSATASVADIGDATSVDRLFEDFLSHHESLNTLINNAGIAGPAAALENIDDDAWDECIRINLSGTFYVSKRAVPLLRKAKNAGIVNIASTAALFGYPLRSAYAASKWAEIGLTKTWAMELGPAGIRVNAVCPTSVSGPRIDGVIAREAEARGLSENEIRDVYLRQTSMRTFVTADEVADTVLFLCSNKAGKISGQTLSVDGHTEGLSNWLD